MGKNLFSFFLSFFVSLKDLKQCLQEAGETVVQLSLGTADADTASLVMATCESQPGSSVTVEDDSKPALQTSLSKSSSSLPSSACDLQDVHMEVDGVKPEAEVPAEAAVVLKDGHNQPAESCPSIAEATPAVENANSCPAPSVAEAQPEENSGRVEINEEIVMALRAAVEEHRNVLASKAELQKNKVSSKLQAITCMYVHSWLSTH